MNGALVDGRTSGDRTPASDRLAAGCKSDFAATMKAFVDACVRSSARNGAWVNLKL